MIPTSARPGRRIWLFGQLVASLVALLPWAWPLVRRFVATFFDSAAPTWQERTRAGTYEHLQPLAVALGTIGTKPERVLDLGCGTGETTLFLSREFPSAGVRGVDLSPEMIRRAAARIGLDPSARVSFRVADASSLPFRDQSFDLVVQVNLPVFSKEVARVLRPGGQYVTVSSSGRNTPFDTPASLYRRAIRRAGMVPADRGSAGGGTWRIANLPLDE